MQEQVRISECLNSLRMTIASHEQVTARLELVKHGLMEVLLQGRFRLFG